MCVIYNELEVSEYLNSSVISTELYYLWQLAICVSSVQRARTTCVQKV